MEKIKLWQLTVILALLAIGCDSLLDPDQPGNLVPKTVTEDPLLPRIEVNGTILHGETFGDINNPIIVFLHGGPGSDYRAFISQIGEENASRYPDERTITNGGLSQLQDEYYCVFYDQRGAGLSPRYDKGVVDFEMYVADLDAVINYYLKKKKNATGVVDNQVYLIGWSFGGILATGYINAHSDKVKDVIMYEPGPFTKEAWKYFKENSTIVFKQIGEDWLEEYLLSLDHITADSHERADYKRLLGIYGSQPEFHTNPDAPVWRLGAIINNENLDFSRSQNYDITSNLSAFQGRLLFIGSDLVSAEYPEYPDFQLPYYPQSERVTIVGVGHMGPWEKPEEISTEIRKFLQND